MQSPLRRALSSGLHKLPLGFWSLGFCVGLILLVQLDLPPQLIQLRLFALSLLEDRWHTSLLLCMAQATGS